MSQHDPPARWVPPEQWLALLADPLDEAEAARLRDHLAVCEACRPAHAAAEQIQRQARALRAAPVDDLTRARLWRALAPAAETAARRARDRRALRTLGATPAARVAAAAIAALVGGAGLFAVLGARRPRADVVPLAEPRPAHSPGPVADLGPDAVTGPRNGGADRAGAAASGAAAGSPLPDEARPDPRPAAAGGGPRYALRPGERRLRCGGLLATRGGDARILQDSPTRARVALSRGEVALRVPRLPRGGGLEVVTPDARVRVIGTRFTVEPHPGGTTTVAVTEGVVWVTPTGRNRATRVLRAGERATVAGEASRLRELHGQLREALAAGRLAEAAAHGRRYLAVTSRPERAFGVALTLAAILVRKGQPDAAARLYRSVAARAASPVARQNALAFLARLEAQRGLAPQALATWERLARRHPGGLYEREALMHLVEARCGQASAAPLSARLGRAAVHHPAAAALLRRCAPPGPRAAPPGPATQSPPTSTGPASPAPTTTPPERRHVP